MELSHDLLGLKEWEPGFEGKGFCTPLPRVTGSLLGDRGRVSTPVGNVVGLAETAAGFDREAVVASLRLRENPPHDVSDRRMTGANAEIIRRIQAVDPRIAPARMKLGAGDLSEPVRNDRGVLVRRYRPEDATGVEQVLRDAGWPADQALERVGLFDRDHAHWRIAIFVAEIDGVVAGAANVEVDYAWKPEAELRIVVVTPERRRQGIAGDLLDAVEDYARERSPGVDAELHLARAGAAPERLLAGRGYEVIARFPVVGPLAVRPHEQGENVIYRLRLS